jgi:Alpha-kinase family
VPANKPVVANLISVTNDLLLVSVQIVSRRSYHEVVNNHATVFTTSQPIMAQLSGNLDKREDKLKGSLKTAHQGRLTPTGIVKVDEFPWTDNVAIKRMYEGKKNPKGGSSLQRQPAPLDMIDTIQELRNNDWSHAMMMDAYAFISEKRKSKGNPPFEIPAMEFVRIGRLTSQKPVRVMIIEEYIDPKIEGKFRKYLDNRSPIPFEFRNPEDTHRGNFLSFVQHVMWERSKGHAFVGDFQGLVKH